jgi:hypothetical protein
LTRTYVGLDHEFEISLSVHEDSEELVEVLLVGFGKFGEIVGSLVGIGESSCGG